MTDINLTRFVNSLSGNWRLLDAIMIGITVSGPYILVLWVVSRWWAKGNREQARSLAIQCGLATALGLLMNQVILLVYHRIRPYDAGITNLLVEKSSDPSFPSDHATVAFAISCCLLLTRSRSSFLIFPMAVLIGFSRVYVGTHYITDVIGGSATGVLGAMLVHRLYCHMSPITEKLVRIL